MDKGISQPQGATPMEVTSSSDAALPENVRKCRNFFSTLIQLAATQSPQKLQNVKTLIQELVEGRLEAATFTQRLQRDLTSSPQPYLIPFMKKALPLLREAIRTKQVVIEGLELNIPAFTSTAGVPNAAAPGVPGGVPIGVPNSAAGVPIGVPNSAAGVGLPGIVPISTAGLPVAGVPLGVPNSAVVIPSTPPNMPVGVPIGIPASAAGVPTGIPNAVGVPPSTPPVVPISQAAIQNSVTNNMVNGQVPMATTPTALPAAAVLCGPVYSALQAQEMAEKIQALEAHVTQLQNILAKTNKKEGKKQGKEFDFRRFNTRHVALKIVYLGWDYHGFAVQEDADKTIEAALFESLIKTKLIESRETSSYHRCGRTDKGVSAFSQVISIDLRTNLLEGAGVKQREDGLAHERQGDKTTELPYVHILNKVLPPEIRVLAWCPVDADFSARFSCLRRTYKYFFPKANLDLKAMEVAAQKLVGEHDYRNLCKMDVGNGVVNYTRKILETSIVALDPGIPGGYEMCELTVVGQAFLWHQVRCIIAILFLVGQGKEEPEVIDELLDIDKHPRKPQYTMAADLPLVLFDCEYENCHWLCDPDWHEDNIRHFQDLWAKHSIKATMLKRMLDHMEKAPVLKNKETSDTKPWSEYATPVLEQATCLMPGNKPRVYRPLLDRDKCDSLEDRIQHYNKRRKVDKDKS